MVEVEEVYCEAELAYMLVMGEELSEGIIRCEEKDCQYLWSVVRAEGAVGSLTGWRGVTSAAILV